jgi:RND family efflux transporter MFP subunit
MKRTAAILILPLLAACRREAPKLEKPPTPVRVTAVEMFTPRGGERYSASIIPNRQMTLAFRVGGFVTEVRQVQGTDGRPRNLEPGDIVEQGTVLARVREKDYDLQASQVNGQLNEARQSEQAAKSQLAQAEAGATKAAADFERASFLYENKSLTRTDYDAAKAQRDATRAQVEAARSQVRAVADRVGSAQAAFGTANLARADTAIAAPFTAAVVQRNIETGTLVGAGTPAFSLAEISSVKAVFGVPDTVAVHLHRGARLPLFLEALPERPFEGTVAAVAAVADAATRLFQVEMTVPNTHGTLRPGMVATVSLGARPEAPAVTVVPLRAIVRGEGAAGFALMLVEGNQARRRPVTLGATYGDNIAVTGVKAGDRVVSVGGTFIADGDVVEVIP